jgi:hypothetical protein
MSSKAVFPYRQVHLDFHTSELMPGVGSQFDPEQFVNSLKTGHVNSVTLFGKCHHGWSYYPTAVGTPHPQLVTPDLLGDMIKACRKENIQTPVYITIQWDELTAREHPEWRVMQATPFKKDESPNPEDRAEQDQLGARWHPVSVIHPELVDRIIRQSIEVIERYDPEGLFLDIVLPWEDISPRNIARMQKRGLNPEISKDRLKNDREVIMEYYQRYNEAIREVSKDIRIFHNSGHIYRGERERWPYFTHLELESLPTGGWGYDHFPVSARYANTLGIDFLGMTGKFHTTWGEFGGYKTSTALEYECAQMVAFGARSSIGDQLHPNGRMDSDTYERIAPAYKRIEQIESYLPGATPVSEIAILSAEAHHQNRYIEGIDAGASRILLETQQMFDIIDWEADLSQYKLLILPDVIRLNEEKAERLQTFIQNGGKIIASHQSLLKPDSDEFALPFKAEISGQREFEPDYLKVLDNLNPKGDIVKNPFVIYQRGISVKATGATVLAKTYDPHFNRSWSHFCSHQHTPYKDEASEKADGILQDGSIIYFAHPLFKEYYNTGQPLLKYAMRNAIRMLLPQSPIRVNLPSSGRISWMRSDQPKRELLHLLYAQPQLRGNSVLGWQGGQSIEIIEDAVPLYNITCEIDLPKKPKKVFSAYHPKEAIPFETSGSEESHTLKIEIPKLYLHELIVIEY